MMDFLNLFSADTLSQIIIVFSMAFYLLECYLGYRCIKIFVSIVGFILGFLIGFFISSTIYTQNAYIPAAIGIVVGIGLAFLAFKLYLVGVFILCGTLAASAVANLPIGDSGSIGVLKTILCVAAFIIVGILAVKFAEICIILVTAITGAVSAVNLLAVPISAVGTNNVLKIALMVILAVTGIIIQKATAKNKSR